MLLFLGTKLVKLGMEEGGAEVYQRYDASRLQAEVDPVLAT